MVRHHSWMAPLAEIPVVFYRTAAGREIVREWLRNLPQDDRRTIGFDLSTLQIGWPIGMPLCRSLGQGLWELRSNLPSRRTARLMFFVDGERIGVVHGFVKKSQRIPEAELEIARKRMKDMQS